MGLVIAGHIDVPRELYVISDKEVTDLNINCREGEVLASRI